MRGADWVQFLQLLLPEAESTTLLRACLLSGEAAERALGDWAAGVGSCGQRSRYQRKEMLPLLARQLDRSGLEVVRPLSTWLGAAYLHEKLRARSFGRHARPILNTLRGGPIPFLVVRDAVLAQQVYPEEGLRHCHGLHLWTPLSGKEEMIRQLQDCGLDVRATHADTEVELYSEAGLRVFVSGRLFPVRFFRDPCHALYDNRLEASICGVRVGVPDPTDLLFHLLGLAACGSARRNLQWASDAVFLLASRSDVDWQRFVQTCRRARLGLPMVTLLHYLIEQFEAPVPRGVLGQLRKYPATPSCLPCVLCHCVCADRDVKALQILRRASRSGVLLCWLRWVILPSPSYLRSELRVEGIRDLSRTYIVRSMRNLTLLWRRLKRGVRLGSPAG